MASQALTTQTGNAPLAPRDTSPFGKLKRQLETREADFHAALASKGISVRNFLGSIAIAVAQDPELLNADRASLILSALRAAQDGLHPDKREAALVIFNQRRKNRNSGNWESVKLVQYMPMAYGLRKKILQARDADGKPIVSSLQVGVVYRIEVEQGYFLWERGSEPEVQHRPMIEIPAEQATDDKIVAAYSIATMADGTRSCEVMRRFEIDKVRECSQTGATRDRNGNPREPSGPWVDWFPEQCKKTTMRRHSKVLPMSGDVIASLGDEDENQYAENAMAIASGSGDAPVLITDESGDTIDSQTGEIVDQQGGDQDAGGGPQPDPEPAKARRGRPPKPRSEAKAESAQADQESGAAAEADQGGQAQTDEIGVTQDPAEAKADQILGDMKDAQNIIDLDRIYSAEERHIAAFPDEIRTVVDATYARHSKRLAPARQPEPAGAK